MRTNELMLYKNMEYGDILKDITFLIDNYESEFYNKEDLRGLLFDCINELLELSVSHGFEGNLWHTYLTFLLASDENAYSTSCVIVGEIEGSLNEIALHDFTIFKEMFDYDFEELEKSLRWTASPGDLILTVGAGDVYTIGEHLVGMSHKN